MTDGLTWFMSALTFAVSMAATPGPNNAMVSASGANFGFARTVPHMLGITVGFPVMLAVVALGAGQAILAAPGAHAALKWAGVLYLLWLAWKIATAAPKADAVAVARPLTFLQAGLFQWVNPKAWVIALGAVAAYTTAEAVLGQALMLAAIFGVVTLPVVAGWTLAGVGAGRLLHTPRGLRAFNLVMAGLLVLSLAPMVLEP